MTDFKVLILGCGSATPTICHAPTAQVVELRNKLYLIDCGEGTQLQMRRYKVHFKRLNHVFISHLHGDHCFGLPGLISTFGMLGRKGDLFIHCPAEVEAFLSAILVQFCKELPYKVCFNVIDPNRHEMIMEDRSLCVYTIPLKHRIPTCGFLFREKPSEPHIIREMIDYYNVPLREIPKIKQGADFVTEDGVVIPHNRLTRPAALPRSYAFCSDTSYTTSIIPYIQGVDCLYHESTFLEKDMPRAKETFHSTALQAAKIALKAGVKQLVLGHYSARYNDIHSFKTESETTFPKVVLSNEGLIIRI
ncbi:MAG: ribonuclease Z [Dysgonamonadaceae bacterium]|jgi:ribonuclease Z|nr:ribonuclease Z [Dysgonamonadaceae bacterium]